MRLIDASRAIFRIEEIPILTDKNQSFYEGCRYMQKRVLRILHTSKTIDAVPVVRCKDCWSAIEIDGFMGGVLYCKFWGHDIDEECFCSYGERKDTE